ncbi:inovirus Gp2 family protein [Dechloromonas sp. CZR5]|uniref:inovirus Gp2 family protein n=1 Tax=Dechloromonas sp. CZR5 TaxID=2608630 RepID=UPI00123DC178|nr:inovirus Gp2 family protein [Dechloromonas sp. CZR5]
MKRHSENNNLKLIFEDQFEGFTVFQQRGPLVEEYLSRALCVTRLALLKHRKTFAFRVDLHFPANWSFGTNDNKPLERFIASFKAKIFHNRKLRAEQSRLAHSTEVSYIWCREIGEHGVPHYHLAILLNRDAFFKLGKFKIGRKNLFNLLVEAWASALGLLVQEAVGLVHIPENHAYELTRDDTDDMDDMDAFNDFIYRVSYLCKAETKHFGDGVHSFGTSRI